MTSALTPESAKPGTQRKCFPGGQEKIFSFFRFPRASDTSGMSGGWDSFTVASADNSGIAPPLNVHHAGLQSRREPDSALRDVHVFDAGEAGTLIHPAVFKRGVPARIFP
jgi:hypothetical protein